MTRNAFEEIMESVELMNDPKFMKDYKRARADIAKWRFEDWEELKSGGGSRIIRSAIRGFTTYLKGSFRLWG